MAGQGDWPYKGTIPSSWRWSARRSLTKKQAFGDTDPARALILNDWFFGAAATNQTVVGVTATATSTGPAPTVTATSQITGVAATGTGTAQPATVTATATVSAATATATGAAHPPTVDANSPPEGPPPGSYSPPHPPRRRRPRVEHFTVHIPAGRSHAQSHPPTVTGGHDIDDDELLTILELV